MAKEKTGTREWSTVSANCCLGCSHACRYCYARANAKRFERIADDEDWKTERVNWQAARKRWTKRDGVVMFPTTHDITPTNYLMCMAMIRNITEGGNRILIVSKPHLGCITAICREFENVRTLIEFRFSIGAANDIILKYWEPGAPAFNERLQSLAYAWSRGYKTSVSCEPLLDPYHAYDLVCRLLPFVTGTIWIGMLNKIRSRVTKDTSEHAIAEMEEMQTPEAIRGVFASLRHIPQIRWKDSYRKVLDLPDPKEPE